MGALTQLGVVNACRAVKGLNPLTTLSGLDDPNVTAILNAITNTSVMIQSQKMWFNTSYPTLSPDVDGFIFVPDNTLEVDSIEVNTPVVQRGSKLYDPINGTDVFDKDIRVMLVEQLTFEDIPTTCQYFIQDMTVQQYQRDFDADPQKMAAISREIVQWAMLVNAQHTRSIDPNFFEEGSAARKINAMRFPGNSGRWVSGKFGRRF